MSARNRDRVRRENREHKELSWAQTKDLRHTHKPGKIDHTKPKTPTPPDTQKILRVQAPHFVAGSVWKRTRGHWRCTHAAPIINWFTRVLHPEVVEGWLRQNHYAFQWLPDSQQATALPQPDGNPPGPVTGTSATPIPRKTQSLESPTLLISSGLEQNGVTTSSLLNAPGMTQAPQS